MSTHHDQKKKQLLVNPFFEDSSVGACVAQGWNIKPENNTFFYQLEEKEINKKISRVQRVSGEARGDGYIWQRFKVKENRSYTITANVMTEGETTAQLWFILLDKSGKVLSRIESSHVLGYSNWTNITMECMAVPESREAMIFAINFTVKSVASAFWENVSVYENRTKKPSEKQIVTTDMDPPIIIPKPKVSRFNRSTFFKLQDDLTFHYNGPLDEYQMIHTYLKKELQKKTGRSVNLVNEDTLKNTIRFLKTNESNSQLHPEGYILEVEEHKIEISASSIRGFYNAIKTVMQVISSTPSSSNEIPTGYVKDWPDIGFRGVHLPVDLGNPRFIEELLETVISPLKYNSIILECSPINWATHPELWKEDSCSPNEVQKIIECGKYHDIEVIPLLQTLGHCEWLFANNQNLDICEDYRSPFCYNPLNERSYKVIFEIMEEAIDLFKPKKFHFGHDEIRMVGRFPNSIEGRKIGFVDLFIQDTNRISSFLQERHITPMMWADVVQEKELQARIGEINQGIWMVDWQYHPFWNYEGIPFLMGNGFKTIGATWYDQLNIETMSTFIKEKQAKGFLQTTWAGFFASRVALSKEIHQLEAYYYAAEKCWNQEGYNSFSNLPYHPKELIQKNVNRIP
ncbi:glycoside hydrolase family 20 zincin-like fold domain-containing protein [Fredinandcohnia humi]